jgi:hypothetical protein
MTSIPDLARLTRWAIYTAHPPTLKWKLADSTPVEKNGVGQPGFYPPARPFETVPGLSADPFILDRTGCRIR